MKAAGLVLKFGVATALAIASISAQAQNVNAPPNLSTYVYTGPVSNVSPSASYNAAKSGLVQVAVKLSDPPLVVQV